MGIEYKDYYKILGVAKTASQDEISKVYKKMARKYHPDLNQGDKSAEDKFKEVNEAHEVLKDPEKRKLYDQLGPNWQDGRNFRRPPGYENVHFDFGGSGGSGFSDFFETLFGGGFRSSQGFASPGRSSRNFSFNDFSGGQNSFGGGYSRAPSKGRDVEAALSLTLEEAYSGGKKSVTLKGASGQGNRSFEVNIPAGVKNGARIRLVGQGDSVPGGASGDMYLKVSILPHADFTLDDADVLYDLPVAPWEAVLGCKVRVPTLGGAVELTIAPGTSSSKKLRLRGKGLGSGKQKGDQLVRVNIHSPENLSSEEVELWNKLKELSLSRSGGKG